MEHDLVEILNKHKGLIYKVCNLYCPDREDRKDLFQEIVIQVWKSLQSFRHESSLSTWMYRIALNTAITHFKKEQRTHRQQLSIQGIEIPVLDDDDDDEKEEQLKLLFSAIQHLDKIDKSIILLYLDEKSYEEISDITGLSKSNVGAKLNRIKAKLSITLKK